MARCNSFYLEPEFWPHQTGEEVRLNDGETRHMTTVLRSAPDQEVRLFDGQGHDGIFHISNLAKNQAFLEAKTLEKHPKPSGGVTLAIGWGKSKRRNYLFEKTVELKGQGIAFWEARRSQGQLPDSPKESWRDKCLQAAKQCGNPFLPELSTLSGGIDQLLEFAQGFDQCYVAWESGEGCPPLTPFALAGGTNLIVIGPEGGLDTSEVDALVTGGFSTVTLGNSILRWETAATYCLSLGFFAQQEKQ